LPFTCYEGKQRLILQIALLLQFLQVAAALEKNNRTVINHNTSSAIRSEPHTEDLPVPIPTQLYILDSDEEPNENQEKISQTSTSTEADFTVDLQFNDFHHITKEYLNDLFRDLDLPKSKAELFVSRLQQCNHFKVNVRISVYRKMHEVLVHFYKMESGLVACTDIGYLKQTLGFNHNSLE